MDEHQVSVVAKPLKASYLAWLHIDCDPTEESHANMTAYCTQIARTQVGWAILSNVNTTATMIILHV